jgi:hypothetical protein
MWAPRGIFPMMVVELQMAMTFDLELGLECGDRGWKYLDEQKRMKTSDKGFKVIDKDKILMPHSLKIHLMGWVCYKLVSEWATTLGLFGLMKESNEYIFFLRKF